MTGRDPFHSAEEQDGYPRRRFLGGAGHGGCGAAVGRRRRGPGDGSTRRRPAATPPERKIKLGLVGCGGRGWWLGELFQKHGGYRFTPLPITSRRSVNRCGDALKVDPQRRFSGLSAYQRVIESGVEAVALIVPPGFLPRSAAAAEAGVHVYMAKPVAVTFPAVCGSKRPASWQRGSSGSSSSIIRFPPIRRTSRSRSEFVRARLARWPRSSLWA